MALTKRYDIRQSPDWFVWRGEDSRTKELLLVKEVRDDSPYRDIYAQRLTEEVEFLSGFDHPHIIRPVRTWPEKRRAAFADVQCHLGQYVTSTGPLDAGQAAQVLVQAAAGLEALHARSLGHGTIQPQSVFVAPSGDVVFADFHGFAFDGSTTLARPDSELRYLAPEMINPELGKPGPSSDLYALGYLALELLAGTKFDRLFGLPAGADWLTWHADGNLELTDWRPVLGHLPGALLDIIDGLIIKPVGGRRYTTAKDLRVALERSKLVPEQRLPLYQHSARPTSPATGELPVIRPVAAPRAAGVPASRVGFTGSSPVRVPPVRKRQPVAEKVKSKKKPQLVLKPINGSGGSHRFHYKKPVLVGRSVGCDLRLESAVVAGKHAVLVCGPDGVWRVFDLKTTHGTFVNGARMGKSRLHPDDELYFAGMGYRVAYDTSPPRKPFDQFELHDRIHVGEHGVVYHATWKGRDGRPAAVRVYPKRFQYDDAAIKRFLRGVNAAATMRHPNLVHLYRGGMEPVGKSRAWFLAMEYLTGGSLRRRLRKGRSMSAPDTVRMGVQLAAGLSRLADEGYVHRNINPGSVLFTDDGTAKLGDFAILRRADDVGGVTNTGVGGPPGDKVYQPPEQLLGGLADARSDVYSLAAVLYEALTGRPPFAPDLTLPELCEAVKSRPVPRADTITPTVPRALADIIAHGLSRSAADRYPTPHAFHAALTALRS